MNHYVSLSHNNSDCSIFTCQDKVKKEFCIWSYIVYIRICTRYVCDSISRNALSFVIHIVLSQYIIHAMKRAETGWLDFALNS